MPQVNINLDDDTADQLDKMAEKDGFDNRSAFVRRLIRQEVDRRAQQFTFPRAQQEFTSPMPEADIEGLATARRALKAARAMQIDFDNILKPDEPKPNSEKEPA